jgi:TP901 family phage tail tape measure protein
MSEFKTIIKVGMNSTSFNASASEMNRKIKTLDSAFKVVSTQAKAFGETTETLKQKHEILTQKIQIQSERVKKLKEQYEKSKKETGENSKETDKLATRYNNAIGKLTQMEGQLKNTTDKMKTQVNEAKKLANKLKELSKKAKDVAEKMNSAGDSFLKLSAPMIAISVASGKLAMDFEESIAKVSTIADETQVSMGKLGDGIMKMSDNVGKSTGELGEALYQTISAGVETGESIEFLNTATKASIGGFTDVVTAVDGLTSTINAYGLEAEEATRISDEMFVAQKFGKTTFAELSANLGDVAPLASQANVSTKELFGSIATLTKQGIKTDKAITGVKSALSNIIKPSEQASKLASELGINFSASALKSKGWTKFLEDVRRKTHGNTEQMATLFGNVKAVNSVLALTSKQGAKEYQKAMEKMENSTGATDEAMEKMANTTAFKVRQSIERAKNSATKAGKALLPLLNSILNVVTPVAEVFGKLNPRVLQFVAILGLVLGTVGMFLKTFASVTTSVSNITTFLSTFNLAAHKTTLIILGVVAGLTALVGLITVLTGQTGDVERVFNSVGNSTNNMMNSIEPPNIKKPRIPHYAAGTNYLENDQYALVHEGEAIIPKQHNPFNPNASNPINLNNSSGDTYNITIDAKNVKEFNDVVDMCKNLKQRKRQFAY